MFILGRLAVLTSLDDWLYFLKESPNAAGFPLVVAGLGMMLFGWRMWKVCVMLAFGMIGTTVCAAAVGHRADQWLLALAGGATLGLISYWLVKYALTLLGGLLGAALVISSLGKSGVEGIGLWAAGGVALVGCTAFAFLNRHYVVIVVTSFMGAILLVSGLSAWVMASPGFFRSLHTLAAGSAFVLPFAILVPTVISFFYQAAEMRRLRVDL